MVEVGAPALTVGSNAAPRFRLLDGLRFVAALSVVIHHFTARRNNAWGTPVHDLFPALGDVTAYGALGVEFFFIISGFVILMTAWGKSIPSYVASRVARLYPAYWVAVAATATLLTFIWPGQKSLKFGEILLNFTMLQGAVGAPNVDGVYWTLFTELRFYIIIGVFMLIGLTVHRVMAFCALWPIVANLAQLADNRAFNAFLLPDQAALFAGGMMIYVIYRHGHSLLAWMILGADALLAAHATVEAILPSTSELTSRNLSSGVCTLIVLGCFALVAMASLTRMRELRWRWLTTAGALTYPLYLLHEYWGWWFISRFAADFGKYIVLASAVVFALVLAWLVNRFVERPLGPMLRRAVARGFSRHGEEEASVRLLDSGRSDRHGR